MGALRRWFARFSTKKPVSITFKDNKQQHRKMRQKEDASFVFKGGTPNVVFFKSRPNLA